MSSLSVRQHFRPARIYTGVTKAKQIPIADLLDGHVQVLDSAMLQAQATAEKGPVHKLRTSTRRMEAQLVLVEQLGGLEQQAEELGQVHRLLKLLRRAAAKVRDLDVQIDLIGNDLPEKAAVHEGTRGDEIRHEGRKLLKRLEKQRDAEAGDLVTTLRSKSEDLAGAMRRLQNTMEDPAEDPAAGSARSRPATYSATELSRRIQDWFGERCTEAFKSKGRTDRAHALKRLQQMNEDTLHDLRKAAKLCRYMAESLPQESATAKKLATRFEYLQETGGRWHDWLLLEQMSSHVHGNKAVLTERYRHHRDAALAEYHLQLALEFTTGHHRAASERSSAPA